MEISARAWQQLGVVPGEVFREIKRGLDTIADNTARLNGAARELSGLEHALSLVVGDYAALYRMDLGNRTVRLEEVAKRLPVDDADRSSSEA